MKHKLIVPGLSALLAVLFVISLAGCGAGAPKVDWELKISGAVNKPLTLNYSDLAKMPQIELKDVLMEKSLGEDTVGSWSGASLAEILKQAEASSNLASITALAAD